MSSPGKCLVIGDGIMGLGSAIGATKIHDKVITFGGVLTSCAASYGISRILRTDYSNLKFSQYAMRSFELWMASYSQFVNKCGRYLVYRPDYVHILDDIDHTRLERGKAKCIRVTEEQVIQAFGSKGNFKHIFGEDAIYVYSPDDCAVDWKGFMDSRRETARGNAVEIREEEVQDLDIGLGRVTRIATKTISYNVNQDDTVILASGGWTSAQMGRWGIPELAESQQPTTVVIISFDIELSAEELAKVQGISIFSVIGCIEFVPPVDGKLKATWLEHKFLEKGSGLLSDPRMLEGSAIMKVATRRVKEYIQSVLSQLGDVDVMGQPQFDSLSDAGMPIIDWHPTIQNLFLSINGNLTCAKLGPLLDQLVENGLSRQPDFPLRNVDGGTHIQPALVPDKSFQETEELAEKELDKIGNEGAL